MRGYIVVCCAATTTTLCSHVSGKGVVPAAAFLSPSGPPIRLTKRSSSPFHRTDFGSFYQLHRERPLTGTRLYSLFDKNKNRRGEENFLSKAISKGKEIGSKLLPGIFGDPDSKEARIQRRRKEQRDELNEGLSTMLRDAPLPVRMMGKMITPLISSMAETFSEQTRAVEDLVEDARMLIVSDSVIADTLGQPVEVGAPFSQSSSSVNINGKQTTRVQASFEVVGSFRSGIATMSASGDDSTGGRTRIDSLRVNVGGRDYNVNTKGGANVDTFTTSAANYGKTAKIDKSKVIDAEFVEKK